MEEKKNLEETLKNIKKEKIDEFIKNRLSHSELLDTQKAVVSVWLEEAINVGYEIGEEHGMGKANPEALGRIIDSFSTALGVGGTSEGDEHLKKIIYTHRGIIRWLAMAISNYESLTDELVSKHIPLKPTLYECMGIGSSR